MFDINQIRELFKRQRPVTRLAPSPTGYLHLGHIIHLLYVWGIGRLINAKILFRIEDHDRVRCKKEYEDAILADLKWFGFVFDNDFSSSSNTYRQSDCLDIYQKSLARIDQRLVYRCQCSRSVLEKLPQNQMGRGELFYPGTCRELGLASTVASGLRLRVPEETFTFNDLLFGTQNQNPASQCGDFLVQDRDGHYTYQFAVTADDERHGVNLIIRGEDLLVSTGRQIYLGRLLGRKDQIHFLHHPLLVDDEGNKLGKRFFSEGVIKYRLSSSVKPAELLGVAACFAGLTRSKRPLTIEQIPHIFSS